MTKSGYCFIQTKPDRTDAVCQLLLNFSEVTAVVTTSGIFDLLAKVEVENNRELQRFLVRVRNSSSIDFVSFFQITKISVPDRIVDRHCRQRAAFL